MPRLSVRAMTRADLPAAGELLAARHRAHLAAEPLLPPAYGDPAVAGREVSALFEREGASGVVAERAGRVVGYLLAAPRGDDWGANMWIESAGHACEDAAAIQDLYAAAAGDWLANGRVAHYVLVPATDRAALDAWARLVFGQQHMHAVRPAGVASLPAPPDGVTIRTATLDDLPDLARIDPLMGERLRASPVFARVEDESHDESVEGWREMLADPEMVSLVAEVDGRVVGSAGGCPVTKSSAHSGLARPDGGGMFAFVMVDPAARGRGVGLALGVDVVRRLDAAGYPSVVTDWRTGNLESARAWPKLGFRETFVRLHRLVGY